MRSSPAARASARASRNNCREAFARVLWPESEIWFPTLNSSLCNTVCGDCVDSSVELLSESFCKKIHRVSAQSSRREASTWTFFDRLDIFSNVTDLKNTMYLAKMAL